MCKKLVYLTSFVLVLGLSSSALAGLHAHYTFDGGEEANDVSGNARHGTLVNGAEVIADPCSEMTGMVLNLSTDPSAQEYVLLPTTVALPQYDPKTVCMFFYARTDRNWARLYYAYNYPDGQIVALTDVNSIGGTLSKGADGGPKISASVLEDHWGEWHHVCLIYDGSDTVIYLDGVSQFSVATGYNFIATGAALGVQYGGGGASNTSFFDGMLDDIRVYDEAIPMTLLDRIIIGDFESAWGPSPEDGAEDVDPNVGFISWSAGDSADSHDVYFGTDETDVTDANNSVMADPCDANFVWAEYKGNQADPNYNRGILERGTDYYWRIDECNTVSGTVKGPVWLFTTSSGKASEPIYPANGGTASQPLTLTWTTCYGVVSHDVYIGRYLQSVAIATPDKDEYQGNWDDNSFNCSTLNMGATYYWRVDEIYPGDVVVPGDIWQFTLLDHMPIEDFERYISDPCLRQAWGGPGYPESAAYLYLEELDGAEETDQSLKMWYANQYNPYFSEGYLTYLGHYEDTWDPWTQTGSIIYVPLDMTAGRGGAIDLWWHGEAGNDDGVMYVALEDADGNCVAVTYEPNMAALDWEVWRMELEEFSDGGLDVSEVNHIYVGVGDRFDPQPESVEGKLWIDQIAVYPPRCLPEYAVAGDVTGDCVVDERDLLVMTKTWLDCDFYEYIPVTEPCEANLVCLYTFESGDGSDSGPHGLDALRGGDAHLAIPADPCRGNWVLELSTDWQDYLYVPHDPAFELSEQITIAAWLNPSSLSGWRTLFSKFGNWKAMYIVNVDDQLRVTLNGACSNWVVTDGGIPLDTWTHLAITNDGTTLKSYLDGEYNNSTACGGPMVLGTDTDAFWIGSNAPWHESWLGLMDDICMYDYALTMNEILSTAGHEGSLETYIPLESDAELSSPEPLGSKTIDQNDFVVMANDWGVNAGFGGDVEFIPPPPELMPWAWWDFENQDANDRADNEFHGTLVGARIVNDLERGWVLECDAGNNEFVALPLGILLPEDTGKSVAFWMKAASSQSWKGILNARNGGNQMRIGIADAGSAMSIAASLNYSQTWCFKDCWAVDEWSHICITSTGVGDQIMYANGVVKTDGWNDYLGAWSDGVAVMGKRAGGTSYYNGRLDDVRIFDWRLTVPEVMMLVNEVPPMRPRGWWTFDYDNVDDSSGNDCNSVLYPGSGTALIVDDTTMGKVLELDGGAWLQVEHSDALTITNAITLMAWINPDDDFRWWDTIMSNDPLKSIYWFLTGGQMGVNFCPPRPNTPNWMTGLNVDSGWTHVAITYDGSMIRAYKNGGDEYAETAMTGDLSVNQGNSLYIGATLANQWSEHFEGRLDDVRIYHWALTEEEIKAIYDVQAP